MKDSFLYVIGPSPYDNCKGDYHTKGNGEWHTDAANIEEALQVIFGSMMFPAEPTGRNIFVPGVSLEGVADDDVIQVWSTKPEVAEHMRKVVGERGGMHNGRGQGFGLEAEIKVTDIEKYCHPVRKLLGMPAEIEGQATASVSPLGASVIKYHEVKHEIQQAAQIQKMELAKRTWEVEAMKEEMEAKMKVMNQQIRVFDAYLHGTRHRTQLCRGNSGTGRYKVFQERVFLSEEVAILGNFVDMDFKGMEALENWLVQSGHIWKLLPHERCILATRIRQKEKDYGDPLSNVYNNMANMQNIIWIRDGENVFHVDVEYDFHNAIFPHKDQFDRAKRVILDKLFTERFKKKPPTNWHGERLKKGEYDVPGQMKRKPLEEPEPYCTVVNQHAKFTSVEEWIDDKDSYPELLDRQINDAVHEFLRNENKRQMIFAVIIQGIVDNTNYLAIPKGTDMFNWENVNTYLELVYDYTHGLPFRGWADKVAPYIDGKVSAGDWIVAKVKEYIEPKYQYGKGTEYSESRWMLFKVIGLVAHEQRYWVNDEHTHKTRTVNVPVVKYHPKASRWTRHYDSYADYQKARTKTSIKLALKSSTFVRVPMSPQYAADILNDREWKRAHPHLVPLMVNYKSIIQAMKAPVNATVLRWDEHED